LGGKSAPPGGLIQNVDEENRGTANTWAIERGQWRGGEGIDTIKKSDWKEGGLV